MKLYVCWGTFPSPRPGGHPCRNAHRALVEAGYDPDVERVYGLGAPSILTKTPGRAKVEELTGRRWVPVLVTDDGEAIDGSGRIVEWAAKNPAGASAA